MSEASGRVIIEGDPVLTRAKIPRPARRAIRTSIAVAVIVTALVLVFARAAIERTLIENLALRSTGATVTIGDVHDALASFTLEGVHVEAGTAVIDVPQATVRIGGPLEVVLRSPHATYAIGAAAGATGDPAVAVVARLSAARAHVRVIDGSIDFVRSSPSALSADGEAPSEATGSRAGASSPITAAAALGVREVNGALTLTPDAVAYELRAAVNDAGRGYPFAATGSFRAGVGTTRLTAEALPLAPLVALTTSPITFRSGELRAVSLVAGATLTADAVLADGAGSAAGHPFSELQGPVAARGDRLATTGLAGKVAGAAFSLVGEVHDLRDPLAALHAGTPELAELARVFGMIAAQPQVRFIRLETTAPGVAFGQYGAKYAIGPRVISLVAVDPAEPTLHLGTAISADHVVSKGERTSDLAQRTGAVAGVNGDYFDIGRSYEPQGLLVRDGTIVRGPTDRAALVIDRANKVTFTEFHLAGTVETGGRRYPVTQVNTWPPGDATVITPDYGAVLKPDPAATFVRLEPVDAARGIFRATSVESAAAGLPVSFGVGFGPLAYGVHPRAGDQFVLHYALAPQVPGAVAGIGGGPILLRDGQWYEDPHAPAPDERDVRWPVVALGALPDGLLLFAAVDGRHPERAVGMTRPEFADLLRSFGVSDAMALDSGGSVTLVARAPGAQLATVRNTPSDDSAERYVSDALLVFSTAPPDAIVGSAAPPPNSAAPYDPGP